MSVARQAFRGAKWLAIFKLLSQIYSWAITITIARILLPEEYGLYAMAFLITGYAEMFSRLGLGSAIVQRKDINEREISSIFWFSIFISILFAVACFPLAYISAFVFDETRIIPLTQSISILFILSGLQIVPGALLRKELAFKTVGKIELISVFVSGICMLFIAYMGGGVWALIGGRLILSFVNVMLLYTAVSWSPILHYNFNEAKSYIKFGLTVSLGGSLFYISENSDRFFAGRSLGAAALGYYSFALQLAQIPTEKIVVLINQVSYPAFSKLQDDQVQFNKFYLDIIKVTGILVMPIFIGGFMLGGDIVLTLLGEKWRPIMFIFELLCLTQIITALNAYNNFVHDARGRPKLALLFNFISAVTMSISFYIAAKYGLEAMLVPWFTVYLAIGIMWILFTLKQLNISVQLYLKALSSSFIAVSLMAGTIYITENIINIFSESNDLLGLFLLMKIILGAFAYGLYFWIFEREILVKIIKIRGA